MPVAEPLRDSRKPNLRAAARIVLLQQMTPRTIDLTRGSHTGIEAVGSADTAARVRVNRRSPGLHRRRDFDIEFVGRGQRAGPGMPAQNRHSS